MRIVGLAYNYKGYEEKPIWFFKGTPSKDGEPIRIPERLHTWPEPELGFRIGSDGVGSYVLANDVTTQILDRDCHLAMSKARDTYCPLVDIPMLFDPANVTLKAFINDDEVVSGHTASRVHMEGGAVGFIEYFVRLFPGDVVLTGCPPHTKERLNPGDVVRCEAWEKELLLARMENPVLGL